MALTEWQSMSITHLRVAEDAMAALLLAVIIGLLIATIYRVVKGPAFIGVIQTLLQVQHGRGGVAPLVYRVIGQAAKGIKHISRVAHAAGQQL